MIHQDGNLGSGGNTGPDQGIENTKRKTFYGGANVSGFAAPVIGMTSSNSLSSIGSNITINSGSTSGVVSRDPSTANHAISNDFDTNEAGEILSLTNSFEKSVKAAYNESNAVKAMPSNKNLTDQERIENDKK